MCIRCEEIRTGTCRRTRRRERERERVNESLTDIFTENSQELANILNDKLVHRSGGSNLRLAKMLGWLTKDRDRPIKANIPSKDRSNFSQEKYKFFLDAPFEISNQCCNVMKKKPAHKYSKETGRKPITAQMASESRLRAQKWLQNGCNGFNMQNPISNPLSFWTENDILQYIYENDLPICSVYKDVVKEGCKYRTTGCDRTGCVLCGFSCHLQKEPTRFQMLHETHPGFYNLLDKIKNNGVTYREAIEWINEHSDLDIKL